MKLTVGRPPEETPEERAARAQFRKSLTPERRATMAIGVITLRWSYLDAEVTQLIFWLKDALKEQETDPPEVLIPFGHKERLSVVRQLLVRLVGRKSQYLKKFDTLRLATAAATEVRHDIGHHTLTISNPTGEDDDVCLMFFRRSKPDAEEGEIFRRYVRDVFQVADLLWERTWDLTAVVVGAINSKFPET